VRLTVFDRLCGRDWTVLYRLPAMDSDKQCRSDAPVFGSENIVSSASSVGVHNLKSDAGIDKRAQRDRRRKALSATSTQQDDLDVKRGQESDSVDPDASVRIWLPVNFYACGQHHETRFVALSIDFDVTRSVARYGVASVSTGEV